MTIFSVALLATWGFLELWPLLGVAAGIYCFVRGLLQVQRKPSTSKTTPSPIRNEASPVSGQVARPATPATNRVAEPAPGVLSSFAGERFTAAAVRPGDAAAWGDPIPDEVVDLTTVPRSPESSAELMTQQAKIAAALQRAGIGIPDIRSLANGRRPTHAGSSTPSQSSPTNGQSLAGAKAPLSKLDGKPAAARGNGGHPRSSLSSRDRSSAVRAASWKSNLMVWGGPALTFACLYLLARQFGWL